MWAIANDPGKAWGWASWRDGVFTSGEDPYHESLVRLEVTVPMVDVCICENFIITVQTARKTQGELWSPKGIGLLEYWCRRANVPFVLQTPSNAKAFANDGKLKRLGWYRPGHGGHANDAARHLLLWFAANGRYNGDTLLAGGSSDLPTAHEGGEPGDGVRPPVHGGARVDGESAVEDS